MRYRHINSFLVLTVKLWVKAKLEERLQKTSKRISNDEVI